MAVKARAEVTLSVVTDVGAVWRYYQLRSSTLAKPEKPTENPPGGSWDDTEPAYTSGSTNSLYVVDLTVFSDGTFQYSDVSLSSSYEAAKAAYNKAAATQKELEDLTVGGRNLLLDTGTEQSIAGGSGWRRATCYLSDYGALRSGGMYTLTVSFTPGAGLASLQLNNSAGLIFTTPYNIAVSGSGRQTASITFTATKDESDHIRLYALPNDGTNTGATVIHWIKLESGSKATDWTPAPEDVQGELDTLNSLTTTENERTVIDGTKIRTGSVTAGRITVRDAAGNTVFDADANGKTVQIGGFAVDADKLAGEKVNISGSEITLTGPNSDVLEQSAHITDANIVWYANDGSGFGARGHIGMAGGLPSLHPDPDGYFHINALYMGSGIRFGYDGGTPEKWFDMDAYGLEAYMPIYIYNDDQSSYVPVNFSYAKAWYYLVKQAEGDPGPDTAPVSGSGRAITSGAMYPVSVTENITLDDVTGVTVAELYAYTVGKMAWVRGQVTIGDGGVYTSWKGIAAGLPKPVANVYDQLPSRGTTYYRPLDVNITPAGALRIRYGANTGGWLYFINLCYPIA